MSLHASHQEFFTTHVSFKTYDILDVTQGSIIGPRLFIFLVNSHLLQVGSNVLLYVDGILIRRELRNTLDLQMLQSDFEKFHHWSFANNLSLNTCYCWVMGIGEHHANGYALRRNRLERTTQELDMGCIASDDLSQTACCNLLARRWPSE